jgi:membrane protein
MWRLLKDTLSAFIEDEALSRGAAIAFYTVTSLAPVLLIVISIAGLVFGAEAARGAILGQLTALMGQQAADVLQAALASASTTSSGVLATMVGVVTLLVTASGMFGEMQVALNRIWKAEPKSGTISNLVRARAASLGLVAALGFLLVVSLVVSAAITALGSYLDAWLPFGKVILSIINSLVSLALLTVLFAAIYKVLPDRSIAWRDVIVGAAVTAVLFTIGKSLIGWYLGSSAVASSYGAAGGLIVLFLWVYYSTQVFLAGAEFTKVYATSRGRGPVADTAAAATHDATAVARAAPEQQPKSTSAVGDKLSSVEQAAREAARNREAWIATVTALKYRLRPSVMKRNALAEIRILKARAARNLQRDTRARPFKLVAVAGALAATAWASIHALKALTGHRRAPHPISRG